MRATVFGLLAAGTLIVSLQWISAAQPENRNLGIEGVILALFFGYLSFSAYRQLKATGAEQPRLGNPKTILIGISIFTALFIAGNVRRIMSARSNDLWIGIGQMVIWLPIFSYYGYREYRRMKNQ